MNIDSMDNITSSDSIITSTFLWCFLMPSIHLMSLVSNMLCIIVFCSHTFIKKPIAIYFICLLISDSITLLIGYVEMIDRESNMIDRSSLLCLFNEKIIHPISEIIYTFMGRFCLEWMLYKVLWTRVSTILLAILSIQRCRTFFSLSYHETRLCAILACIFSITFASLVTCMEWTGVQYDQVRNPRIFFEMFQSMMDKNSSRDFYINHLTRDYNRSNRSYPCLIESLNLTVMSYSINQSNCSSTEIGWEYQSITRSFVSNGDPHIVETIMNFLINSSSYESDTFNHSLLDETIRIAKTPEILGKLFDKRSCHITLTYSLWLMFYEFFHSVSFGFNRRVVAIFLANALPSFVVASANLVSIRVIYFSQSLKYLKQSSHKNRRKRRLQNDLRAFLVILIESFSIILISWGIPIFLTMYHCRTLYVISINHCPKIKDYLALFLCTDLFNSSTNCLLYSLSGKLFRRKVLQVVKSLLTCGRGTLWNKRPSSALATHQPLDRQPSHNPSTNYNHVSKPVSSRAGSGHLSEHIVSSTRVNQTRKVSCTPPSTTPSSYKRTNGQKRSTSDEGSFSLGRGSDDQHGGKNSSSEFDTDSIKRSTEIQMRKNSLSIGSYLIGKVRAFGSVSGASGKRSATSQPITVLLNRQKPNKIQKKFLYSILSKHQTTTDLSLSSSSFTGSAHQVLQQTHSPLYRQSIPIIRYTNNSNHEHLSTIDHSIGENLTSL